jgi:hypothetical protein
VRRAKAFILLIRRQSGKMRADNCREFPLKLLGGDFPSFRLLGFSRQGIGLRAKNSQPL